MSSIKRIIIIDDDPFVGRICCHIIKRSAPGIDVCLFTSPEEGLKYIRTSYVSNPVKSMLLLDINMPILSGWHVLEGLACVKETIKEYLHIFVFSSSVTYKDKERSNRHPLVTGFIEKPLTKQKLLEIMLQERYLDKQYTAQYSNTENSIYCKTLH